MKFLRQRGIPFLVLAAMLAMTLTGCGAGGGPGGRSIDVQTAESSVLTVQIENPVYSSIYLKSQVVGTVEPEHTAEVYPKTSGTVTAVYFEVGDTVQEGQILATLDSDSLNAARISIDTAQLSLENAQKDLERAQVLYENDGITKQALENSESAVRSAQLQLESAQDNYNTLQKNVNITAPISGVIESRDVEVYDNASMQKSICVISQKSNMQVVFQVPERVKHVLQISSSVALTKNGTTYTATVTEIPSKTVDDTGLFEIEAQIKDGGSLSTGSKVTVELTTDKAENVLCIPVDAVYYDNGEPYVYISNNGIAEIVFIETGIYDEDQIQVLSGLSQNTRVITSWSSQLTDGAAVQSVEEAEKKTDTTALSPEAVADDTAAEGEEQP
ncbi:MAG: efflux RND transporter periplasmic adaptor subunit [Peptococcaceae bacterium]